MFGVEAIVVVAGVILLAMAIARLIPAIPRILVALTDSVIEGTRSFVGGLRGIFSPTEITAYYQVLPPGQGNEDYQAFLKEEGLTQEQYQNLPQEEKTALLEKKKDFIANRNAAQQKQQEDQRRAEEEERRVKEETRKNQRRQIVKRWLVLFFFMMASLAMLFPGVFLPTASEHVLSRMPALGSLEQAVIFFATWFFMFHALAKTWRDVLTADHVRRIDYVYLPAGFFGVALKMRELYVTSPNGEPDRLTDILLWLCWSETDLGIWAYNVMIAAIAMRVTRTTMEIKKWHRA
ncbi:MAG: hypothetical protein ACK4GK_01045 [Ferrovibrio sp.]